MARISDADVLEHTAKWMTEWAEAAAKGEVVSERAMDDGGRLVETRWPAHADYLEHARDLWVLEAMAAEDRAARAEGAN